MARTCCPQYTIRHDARAFKPDKKHRAVINRFNRFLETGSTEIRPPDAGSSVQAASSGGGKAKGKGKAGPVDWMAELHRWESSLGQKGKKAFTVSISP